jgi:hypothetical protein
VVPFHHIEDYVWQIGITLFAGRMTIPASPENVMLGVRAYCSILGDPSPLPFPLLGHPCVVIDIDVVNHSHAPYLCRIQVYISFETTNQNLVFSFIAEMAGVAADHAYNF